MNLAPEVGVGSLGRVGMDVLGVVLEGVDPLQGLPADGALEATLGPRHGDGVEGCTAGNTTKTTRLSDHWESRIV